MYTIIIPVAARCRLLCRRALTLMSVLLVLGCMPYITFSKKSDNVFDKFVMNTYSFVPAEMKSNIIPSFDNKFPVGSSYNALYKYMISIGGKCTVNTATETVCNYENDMVVMQSDTIPHSISSRQVYHWILDISHKEDEISKVDIDLESSVTYGK